MTLPKGYKHSEETKKKISKSSMGKPPTRLGATHSDESKQKMSESTKKSWQDPEYAKKVFKSTKYGKEARMSGPEKEMEALLLELNLPFKFVGHFEEIIGTKCPDFIDSDRKKIVEVYGDYFHKGEDPEERVNYYKQYDYECVVIWASELKDKKRASTKLLEFAG